MSGGSLVAALSGVCSNCPTPSRRQGMPQGECPVCGTFWVVTWGDTNYGIVAISREEYQRWLIDSGTIRPNGSTVPLALQTLPNVVVRNA